MGLTTVSFKPTANADSGKIYWGSGFSTGEIQLGRDLNQPASGFCRFPSVNIAPGKKIRHAYVKLYLKSVRNESINLTIDGNDVDNATAPTSYAEFNSLVHTTASVQYSTGSFGGNSNESVNDLVTIVDIAPVVQEIIDRAGWSSGNAITIIFNGDSGNNPRYCEFHSYESSNTYCPELIIAYDDDGGPSGVFSNTTASTSANIYGTTTLSAGDYPYVGNDGSNERHAIFEMASVSIPKEATVDTAKLYLVLISNVPSAGVTAQVHVALADNQGIPANISEYNGLTWSSAATATPNFYGGRRNRSLIEIDVSDILQGVVDRAGWAAGNKMLIRVTNNGSGSGNTVQLASTYRHTNDVPFGAHLLAGWTPKPNAGVTKLVLKPGVSGDDGDTGTFGGGFDNSGDDMWIGAENNPEGPSVHTCFLRIPNVTIPQGAAIRYAYLTLFDKYADQDSASLEIRANDVDDATAPTDATELAGLTLTTAKSGDETTTQAGFRSFEAVWFQGRD